MSLEIKTAITDSIHTFKVGSLYKNSLKLFKTLGYNIERSDKLDDNTYKGFIDRYDLDLKINEKNVLSEEWNSIELLFQLTKHELEADIDLFDTRKLLLKSQNKSDEKVIIESYLFFAIELKKDTYTRTQLSKITREINKIFPMPVMVLFKHCNALTFAIIDRRLHKREESKDVLKKVTLIKDININNPHRGHIEILFDLSLSEINNKYEPKNFIDLHHAWKKVLDSSELNKRFYREIANWFFWALDNVEYPDDLEKDKDIRNATNLIRLLTRLIFVWFLKEKGLVPDILFDKKKLQDYLDFTGDSIYYKAILQNLFFATLNVENDKRIVINRQYGIPGYRYSRFFKDKDKIHELFDDIPFVNGGLFENLDKNVGTSDEIRIDCFSDRRDNDSKLNVPDYLLFQDEQISIDLSDKYGDKKRKKEKVRGLIDILESYKFTITENTPIEEEIALDPELLGKVFENLLAAYNPETQTTARKQTGSFYTPREIVHYMVDESLIAYLENKIISAIEKDTDYLEVFIPEREIDLFGHAEPVQTSLEPKHLELTEQEKKDINNKLRKLISFSSEENPFQDVKQKKTLINAIDNVKILDPACGSGAFPMGILHKMVHIIHKLDPNNAYWMEKQIARAEKISDQEERQKRIEDIEEAFLHNELDYPRKLYLIENCIYGVDIQPIAVQIAKLRFFISLIVDQRQTDYKIRPLPNLETKFVAANTLIGIEKKFVGLFETVIKDKEEELAEIRKKHFGARTPKTKAKWRKKDEELRNEIAHILENDKMVNRDVAKKLAYWDPYDQNTSADFFDPEWMFGIDKGFDIVIGNPPYVITKKNRYKNYKWNTDLYLMFFEINLKQLLKEKGILCFITPKFYLLNKNCTDIRKYIINQVDLLHLVETSPFDAVTENIITLICNRGPSINKVIIFKETKGQIKSFNTVLKEYCCSNPNYEIVSFIKNDVILVMNKMSIDTKLLGKISYSKRGAEIGKKALRNTIKGKPILIGLDVQRYLINLTDSLLDFNHKEAKRLEKYFSISDVVYLRRVASDLTAAVSESPYAFSKNIYGVFPDKKIDKKYLLALLNSKILNFYYKNKFSTKKDDVFPEIQTYLFESLPIKIVEKQQPFIKIVNQIIKSKQNNIENDTSTLENTIDIMAYKLYDLIYDEVKIVDPDFKLSEKEYDNFKIE